MKKQLQLCLVALLCLGLYSCQKSLPTGDMDSLPEVAAKQIETGIANWNNYYGTEVTATDWTYLGEMNDAHIHQSYVEMTVDPDEAWFPSIDLNAGTGTALQLSDDPNLTREQIEAWQSYVASMVKDAKHVAKIEWEKNGKEFSTFCFFNESGIVYDNMMFYAVEPLPKIALRTETCLNLSLNWIWGSNRGNIIAKNQANCDANGNLINCDKDCSATCTLCAAQINCRSNPVAGQDCCQLEYSWAYAAGFTSISVGIDGFTLSASGILGSYGNGNGSCTTCCRAVIAEPIDF